MIKINIVLAISVFLVLEYFRRKYIDKRVAEQVQASLNRSESAFKSFSSSKSNTSGRVSRDSGYDSMRYWQCITGQLGPYCKP